MAEILWKSLGILVGVSPVIFPGISSGITLGNPSGVYQEIFMGISTESIPKIYFKVSFGIFSEICSGTATSSEICLGVFQELLPEFL